MGVPGHFLTKDAFIERDPRGIQKSTREPTTPRGSRVTAPSSFNFQWKAHGRADQKKCDFPRFLALFQFDVFLKGDPMGIQKPKWDLPKSCGTRDMAAGSFNFIGKHKGYPNKKCAFLNYWFSDPWEAQILPMGPCKGPNSTSRFL